MTVNEELEYGISEILNSQQQWGGLQYLVWWWGYGPEEDEWIHKGYMGNAEELTQEFHEQYPEADK